MSKIDPVNELTEIKQTKKVRLLDTLYFKGRPAPYKRFLIIKPEEFSDLNKIKKKKQQTVIDRYY